MVEGSTFGPMAVFIRETTWMAIGREKGTCRAAYVSFFRDNLNGSLFPLLTIIFYGSDL
jgi:hypothetical protein